MMGEFNKRGQNSTLGYVIGFVVIVVAAIVVILFVTKSFGTVTDIKETISPDILSIATVFCQELIEQQDNALLQSGISGIKNSYCLQFKDTEEDGLVSCEYEQIRAVLESEDLEPIDCSGLEEQIRNKKQQICNEATASERKKIKINGETCNQLFAGGEGEVSYSYIWSSGPECGGGSEKVSDTFCKSEKLLPNSVCCKS